MRGQPRIGTQLSAEVFDCFRITLAQRSPGLGVMRK